ncbi:hypothetical protein MEX01_25430 [Methylorubrum extorquens]|nr:hypothetical protein MEX01_25430 [Methylorubrum extorquens]
MDPLGPLEETALQQVGACDGDLELHWAAEAAPLTAPECPVMGIPRPHLPLFHGSGDIRVATQVLVFVELSLRLLLGPTMTLPFPVISVVPATGLAILIFIISATLLVTVAIIVAAAAFTWPIIIIVIVPATTNAAVALAIASTTILPLVVAVVTPSSLG